MLAEAEGLFADLLDRRAVREQADIVERDALPGFERACHGIGIGGLHADDLDVGAHLFDVGRHARDQSAAADGAEDGVDRRLVLAQYLHGDGALSGDHIGIVERVHESELSFFLKLIRVAAGIAVAVAVQHDLHGTLAEMLDRVDLDLRRGGRHHDDSLASEAVGGERYALRMVARRGGDHAALELLGSELRHLVVCAAQLEREHRLHVFALEQHGVADARRQVGRVFQRRFDRHVIDAGSEDTFEIALHDVLLTIEFPARLAGNRPNCLNAQAGDLVEVRQVA